MANRIDQTKDSTSIVIDGFEQGIASSPYKGIANIRNLSTTYYPDVAYVNYRRQLATISDGTFFAGTHSTNVSNNTGWIFTAPSTQSIGNPVQKAVSPSGLIYILDSNGEVFKQSAVNSTTFNIIQNGGGRFTNGAGGLAWWNNYIVVFGNGVIEWCGDGTGDAGITSANWNINTGTGFNKNSTTFTTSYSSSSILVIPYPRDGYPKIKNNDRVTLSTTGTLPGGLSLNTTYYVTQYINNNSEAALALSTSYSNANQVLSVAPVNGNTSATLVNAWQGTTGTYTVLFSTGESKSTTLTNGSASFSFTALTTSGFTTSLSVIVTLTSDGTGTHTLTDIENPTPIGNATNLNVSLVGSYPSTSLTLDPGTGASFGTYVNAQGTTITGVWQGATGLYNVIMQNGQKVPANFTNGSSSINLLSSLNYPSFGSNWSVQFLDPTVTNYRPYVSKVDGSLMFCNGQFIGRISESADPNLTFFPSLPQTYNISFGVTSIPEQFTDTVTNMVDLKSTLVVAGQRDVYAWDYVSASTSSPSPVGEQIKDMTNLLNNVYVLAGQKGNIYVSNGYSAQLLFKIPDFIAGIIDPVWTWGSIMVHRSKLFFQTLAQKTDGTNILAGIFSLIVSPSMLGETASGLVMESQNSYGLTPASGATGAGLLIDNSPSANGNDSYYSVWSNGASTGGIDYNDTTLWQNWEPVIETDLVFLGSNLEKKSLGQMEFLLDRPMATGDSIRMSWRGSLTDSYSTPVVFTTANADLSGIKNTDLSKKQWVQFKIEFSCASSGSSFLPLREIRVHLI